MIHAENPKVSDWDKVVTFHLRPKSLIRGIAIAAVAITVGYLIGVANRQPDMPQITGNKAAAVGAPDFRSVAKSALPSVVNIKSATVIPGRRSPMADDPFFQFFFGGQGDMRIPDRVQQSLGSGVIVSKDGLILTNNHVVNGATQIQVTLSDGRSMQAKLVGTDPGVDLALLRISANNLPAITFADSSKADVGEWVLAIGAPFGLKSSVTVGIVSAKGRSDVGINLYEDFIQTDAAINPGNSGGALVNANGELIGINTAIFSQSGGSVGIGFAIPSRLAQQTMATLLKSGTITRGWLGIIPSDDADVPTDKGIVVANLFRSSPADKVGVQPGDVIVKVDNRSFKTSGELKSYIIGKKAGEKVNLTVKRGSQEASVDVPVMDHPFDSSGRAVPGI